MRIGIAVTIVLAAAAAGMADAEGVPTRPSQPKRFVAVFDFVCPAKPELGRQMAYSVRKRLGGHTKEYEVIDALTLAEFAPAGGMPLATADKKIIDLLNNAVGANMALWGRLDTQGGQYTLTVRLIDLPTQANRPLWQKRFTDKTERARGLVARQVVEAIRGRSEWTPPEYGDEAEPTDFGRPLNRNGSFDAPGFHPAGWEHVDGVSTMLATHPQRGRVLRIFTNLDRDKWLAWQHKLRLGQGDPRHPPAIGPAANKYAAVGALEGARLVSNWIDAEPGRRHWLTAEMKGKTTDFFFPKIFVRGYADFAAADSLSEVSLHERKLTPAAFAALPKARQKALIAADAKAHPDRYRRMVYEWYLACRNERGTDWKHYAAPFPPRGGLPANVKYFRLHVYAYWPLGEYLFDNVHLHRDPRQRGPLPEAKPRTIHFEPTTGDTRPSAAPPK